jgi:hypothetical protein
VNLEGAALEPCAHAPRPARHHAHADGWAGGADPRREGGGGRVMEC